MRWAPVIAVLGVALASGCSFGAMPADEHGRGETEELSDALALHDLGLPDDVSDVEYTVHSSIDSHAVGLRFRTGPAGVDELLDSVGVDRDDLRPELNPWGDSSRLSDDSPDRYGWSLAGVRTYAGVEVDAPGSRGATGVLVDLTTPDQPTVYVEALDCC